MRVEGKEIQTVLLSESWGQRVHVKGSNMNCDLGGN